MTGAVNENVVRNVLGRQKKKKKRRDKQALIIWSVQEKERKRNRGVRSKELFKIEQAGGK